MSSPDAQAHHEGPCSAAQQAPAGRWHQHGQGAAFGVVQRQQQHNSTHPGKKCSRIWQDDNGRVGPAVASANAGRLESRLELLCSAAPVIAVTAVGDSQGGLAWSCRAGQGRAAADTTIVWSGRLESPVCVRTIKGCAAMLIKGTGGPCGGLRLKGCATGIWPLHWHI